MNLKKVQQILISYWVFINAHTTSNNTIWHIIKIINAFYLLLIIIHNVLIDFVSALEINASVELIYNFLQAKTQNGEPLQQIGYVLSFLLLILLFCIIICLTHQTNLTNSKKRGKLLTFAIYYPIFLIMLVQVFYSYISYFIINSVSSIKKQSFYTIFFAIFSKILLWFVTLFNTEHRLYSFVFFIVVGIIIILNNIVSSIIVILITIFMFINSQNIVSKSIYICVLSAQVFRIIQSLSTQNGIEELIFLGASLIFGTMVVVSRSLFKLSIYDKQLQNNKFLVQCVKQLDRNGLENLQKVDYLKIQAILKNFTLKYRDQLKWELFYKIAKTTIKSITFNQFIQIIDEKLRIDCQKSINDLRMKQIFLTFRIKNAYKMNETISKVSQILDCEEKGCQKQTVKQMCIRKNIELVVMQQFMSKQPNNQKIYDMIKLSKIQQQFMDKTMQIFSYIYSFWQKVNMNVLIECIIEQDFQKIQNQLTNLKQLLIQLKQGYKAAWQTRMLSMITKLIQPYTIIKQVDSGNKISQLKQQSLIFFVLRNKKVVQASPSFLKLVDSAYQEIVNQKITNLVPQEVITVTKQKQYQAIKSNKVTNIIPIITQDFSIKIYQANLKLEPRANSGIYFFYFLKKYQNQQKFAFLYLNSADLSIKFVSDQFYDVFDLNKKEVWQKFNKHQVFLHKMVTNYNANQIIKDIKLKKTLKCNFSVQSLRYKKKKSKALMPKYHGFLNLFSVYDSYMLLYINITGNQLSPYSDPQDIRRNNSSFASFTEDGHKQQQLQQGQQFHSNQHIQQQKQHAQQHSHMPMINMKKGPSNQQNDKQTNKPFAQKVQQKQAQLSSQTKSNIITYSNCIKVMSTLMIICSLTIPTLQIVYAQQRPSSFDAIIQNIDKSTDHSNLLIDATFQVFLQYLISDNMQFYQQFMLQNPMPNTNSSISYILQLQYQHIHSVLFQFHNIFTSFFYRANLPQPYTIVFKNYTINADFSTTNLIDYSYNIKLASQRIRVQLQTAISQNISFYENQQKIDNPLWFLLTNYPTISQIKQPFESLNILQTDYNNTFLQMQIIVSTLSLAYVIFFILVAYFVRCKIQIILDIFYIFALTSADDINKRLDQVKYGIQQFLTQLPKDSLKKIDKLKLVKDRYMLIYHSSMKDTLSKIFHQNDTHEQIKTVESNKKYLCSASCKYISGMVIVTLLLFSASGAFLYSLQMNAQVDSIIFQYHNQINWIKYKQLKSSCDMFHHQLSNAILGVNTQLSNQIYLKQISVNKQLSTLHQYLFTEYFDIQSNKEKQDLCANQKQDIQIERFMVFIQCKNIGLGILHEGLAQAQQYYDKIMIQLYNNNTDLYNVSKNQQYANILIHLQTRQRILNKLQQIKQQLYKKQQQISSSNNLIILIQCVMCFIAAIIAACFIFFKFIPDVMKIKNIGIGYFKLFSKQTLMKNHICNYISEKRILDRIVYL